MLPTKAKLIGNCSEYEPAFSALDVHEPTPAAPAKTAPALAAPAQAAPALAAPTWVAPALTTMKLTTLTLAGLTLVAPAVSILIDLSLLGLAPVALAKSSKPPAKAAPKQRIFSLSQEQKNSDSLKIWGVSACVMLGSENPRGLYITGFTGEGIGSQLGLQIGDVLISINGHVVTDAKQADAIVYQARSGHLQAVVARAESTTGSISLLSPKINFSPDTLARNFNFDSSQTPPSTTGLRPSDMSSQNEMSVSALEDYMFQLVNEDRKMNGNIPPLTRSSTLGTLARKYADDMKKRNFFGHDDPDGLNPTGRARRDGITVSVWENLASESGSHDYKRLVLRGEQQMMAEPRDVPTNHRGCILREQHHCVGIGVAVAPSRVICVQEFSPADLP